MKIGIIGYQGAGKSSLFEWLTGVAADPALSHLTQSAAAEVPDARIAPLCEIYAPKKVTIASLEIVDTPGLSRDHEGSAARLAMIREAGCLIQVVEAYSGTNDPKRDLLGLQEDFLLADLEIISGRVDRLRESLKKPRPNREEQAAELAAIEPLMKHLEDGKALHEMPFTEEQSRAVRSFQLITQKPRLAILNVADDSAKEAELMQLATEDCPVFVVPVGLELELSRMEPSEREAFRAELGIASQDKGQLLRSIMDQSGQMLFFTAGEKEVRTWMVRKGATAVEAAGAIHTDLARGFIRSETMSCADLIRVGSEREIKAQKLMRQEPKDYVIQDGDILNIRFSV
jgi:ribosome-binding ATPase